MIRSAKAFTLGTALFLAACSGGRETSSSLGAALEATVTIAQDNRETRDRPEPPPLTRDVIDRIPAPALEVVLEDRGVTGIVVPYASRRDGRNGTITTWRNGSGSQIVLRDGVLISTRGIGNDLGSSRVDAVVQSINTRQPVSGPHNLFVLGYANYTTRIDLECEMESLGETRIEIFQRAHSVVHLRQNCVGPDGPVTNDYWVDRSSNTVWQSRQWAGPDLGYFRIRKLKK